MVDNGCDVSGQQDLDVHSELVLAQRQRGDRRDQRSEPTEEGQAIVVLALFERVARYPVLAYPRLSI